MNKIKHKQKSEIYTESGVTSDWAQNELEESKMSPLTHPNNILPTLNFVCGKTFYLRNR